MKMLNQNLKGYLTLIGGFLIHIVCGKLYIQGIINPYIVSYFRQLDYKVLDNEFGLIVLVVMIAGAAIGLPYGVRLIEIFGSARKVTFTIGSLAIFSLYISSYIKHFPLFLFFYAFSFGACIGVITNIPLYMAKLCFPNHQNLVCGLVLSGNSFSAIIFGTMSYYLINPNNIQPSLAEKGREYFFDGNSDFNQILDTFPSSIRLIAYYLEILIMVGSMLIFHNPQQIGEEQRMLTKKYEESIRNRMPKKQQNQIKLQLINCIIQSQKQYNFQIQKTIENKQFCNQEWELQTINSTDTSRKLYYSNKNSLTDIKSDLTTQPNINFESPEKLKTVVQNKFHLQRSPDSHNTNSFVNSILFESDEIHQNEVNEYISSKIAIVSLRFFLSLIVALFSISFGLFVNGYIKNIGFYENYSDEFLTLTQGLTSFSVGLGRFLWQFLSQKLGYKKCYQIILIMNVFLSITFQFISHLFLLFIIYILFIQSTISGVMVLFPKFSEQLLGGQVAQKLSNYTWFSFSASMLIQVAIAVSFKPLLNNCGIYYINALFSIISLVIIQLYQLRDIKDQNCELEQILITEDND